MGHNPKMTPKKAAEYKQLAADGAATAKARELWGQYGFAWLNPHGKEGDIDWYRVGLAVGDVRDLWKPFGRGKDWQSAFEDAKKRGYCA